MGNSSSNVNGHVDSVDIELDFEIDPVKGQSEIRKFGYYFNAKVEEKLPLQTVDSEWECVAISQMIWLQIK